MIRFVAPSALAVLLLAASARAGEVDGTLRDILDKAAPDQAVSALVYLDAQVDIATLNRDLERRHETRAVRHEWVVRQLQETAAATQGDLVNHLKTLLDQGRIDFYEPYWIVNAVRVIATKDELEALADRADVLRVYYDFEIEGIKPVHAGGADGGAVAGGPEQGLVAVRAPEAWALGFTGQDVLVSSLDTGVDGNHAALAARWRGLDPAYAGHPEWAWFDPVTNTTFPQSFGSHGTHTMGTICGGAPGNQVGVAPGSDWIHAAVIDRVSIPQTVADAILSFQWIIDPDENPGTVFDVPRVNSNSWGLLDAHGYPACDQTFWTFLDACEAAGIVMVFAAGNEGFSGLRRPADRATDEFRTFSVAALDGNTPGFPVAGFSSRGPTFCTPGGGAAVKPDIAAPGVNVISALPGGLYGPNSGTSMATPHIAGIVALVYSANPDLSVEQVKQIIYETASDLGPAGEDNDYGWGIADAFEAVTEALSTSGALAFSFPSGHPDFIDPNGGTTIPVIVSGQTVQPISGSGLLHYSADGINYTPVAMIEGAPNEYDAVFPSFPCGSTVRYYFSADAEGGETSYSPFLAPEVVYQRDAWTGTAVSHYDDMESDQGWTTEIIGATSGQWQRGVPIAAICGSPGSDGDDSGQCWVTQNSAAGAGCLGDVDLGSVRLTSPILDATANPDDVEVSYWRWYSNNTGASPNQDTMLVEISNNGGAAWTTLEIVGPVNEANGGWFRKSYRIADFLTPTSQFRIRFTASDTEPQSVVEAGIDGLELSWLFCDEPACPYDLDGSGDVGINDLLDLLADWGNPWGINDLLDLLAAWGPC